MTCTGGPLTVRRSGPASGMLLGRFLEIALAAGFDEGLFVDEAGMISEGTVTNVGFWRD